MAEAVRWLEEGHSYRWIVEEYRRKYQVETTISLWSALRRRRGIPKRIVRDESLVPWAVKEEHRHGHAVAMLRAEARRRAGKQLTPGTEQALDVWLAGLERDRQVVHYAPETPEGWWYVPPREGIDVDLIRVPDRQTGRRNFEPVASGTAAS